MKMKDKLIELIKKYRAESGKLWTPTGGYANWTNRATSLTYDKCADDLEKLVQELEKGIPPCMNEKIITSYPHCRPKPKTIEKNKCSIFIALGCHGFWPSSDAAKSKLSNP